MMSIDNVVDKIIYNENTQRLFSEAILVVLREIRSQEIPLAKRKPPYLLSPTTNREFDNYYFSYKDGKRKSSPERRGTYYEVKKNIFRDVIKTIHLKNAIEKKQIALQLLGFEVEQSTGPLQAEHVASIVGMFLEFFSIQSEEIDSLRKEISASKGDQERAQMRDKIEGGLKRIKKRTLWNGNIKEACDFIEKKIKINQEQMAYERDYPVSPLAACKRFLKDYIFPDKEDYTPEMLHENYRKFVNNPKTEKKGINGNALN